MSEALISQAVTVPPMLPFPTMNENVPGMRGEAVTVGRYDSGLYEYIYNGVSCVVPKSHNRAPFENDFFARCKEKTFSVTDVGCACENLKEGIAPYLVVHGKVLGIPFDISSFGAASYTSIIYFIFVFVLVAFPVSYAVVHYKMKGMADRFDDPGVFLRWCRMANSYNLALISILFGTFLVYSNIQSKTTINLFGQNIETSVPGLGLIFLGFVAWYLASNTSKSWDRTPSRAEANVADKDDAPPVHEGGEPA